MPLFPDTALPAAPRRQRREAPAAASETLKDKALEIHRRLCGVYDCPIPYFHSLDPLSELISSLLSHRTRNAESGRAFKALRTRWPDWAAVEKVGVAEIEETIRGVTWPELKAPRIKAVLSAVRERVGTLSLDFLQAMSVDEARGWLEAIPGIGPKTSAAALSFSTLRMPALPVDSHHHRVAQRTGLIGPKLDVGPSHAVLRAQLPDNWSAQTLYDNHEVLMLHGQRVCFHRSPACGRCVLLDICPAGRARGATATERP